MTGLKRRKNNESNKKKLFKYSRSNLRLEKKWDNLLIACKSCNSSKNDYFGIEFSTNNYDNDIDILDKSERPLIVNPERINQNEIDKKLKFNINGEIFSDDIRFQYTINRCNLNSPDLVSCRTELLKDLVTKNYKIIYLNYLKNKDKTKFNEKIIELWKKIKEYSINEKSQFSTFMKYFAINFNDYCEFVKNN